MTFIDFFAGIGGFRLGMEMAGHKCVGHCEIDKFADKSYRAMHDVKGDEWFASDIRRVDARDMPEADCYCGGFPCQAFSVAGKRRGFEDMRGTLIFEVFRLAAERKPKVLFLENVAGLLNHDGGRTFGTILCGLWELGYDVQWQVLNSKNFGVPQNRERVLIIGHHGGAGESGREVFPIYGTNGKALKQVADLNLEGRHESACRVYGIDGAAPCLNTCGGGGLETKIMIPQGLSAGGVFLTASTVITKKESTHSINAEERTFLIMGKDGRMKNKEQASCLTGGGHSGGNHSDMDLIVQAVLTPDRAEKRQNGRRFKEDGEEMFTLTGQDRHGVMLRPVRTDYGKAVRKQYESGEIKESRHNMTALEPRQDEITNTLSTVQKDNLLLIPKGDENNGNATQGNSVKILQILRSEIGEKAFEEWGINIITALQQDGILQQGVHEESVSKSGAEQSRQQISTFNSEEDKYIDYEKSKLREVWEDWKVRYSSSGRELSKQLTRELNGFVQKLSYETTQSEENLYYLWVASEGLQLLRETLSKIQEIWKPINKLQQSGVRIRRLLPIECFRLQGFPDEYFERAAKVNSDSQLYKQAGNSVSVPVIYEITKRLV